MNELKFISNVPMPTRIKGLPRDDRGFPIPYFVITLPDGTRDFRIIDRGRLNKCVKRGLCWICGGRIGVYKAFVIGPMCSITRTTSEPPSHRECAEYACRTCPFLTKPRMRRNDKGFEVLGTVPPPGVCLERNPGVTCLWLSKDYEVFKAGTGADDFLIKVGDPVEVVWYAQGRAATRAEVQSSIDSGYPALEQAARDDREPVAAMRELEAHRRTAARLLPVGAS
jgi:hypothetical protein